MQGIEDPEVKSKFNNVIAAFQLILLIIGTILLGFICAYINKPTMLYLGGLHADKKHFLKTYKEGKYDFLKDKNVDKKLSNDYDYYALYIANKVFDIFVTYGIIVGLNLLNTLLGIIGYIKKKRKLISMTALLSIVITVVFIYYLAVLNYQVQETTFSLLNETLQKQSNIRQCSICYKSVQAIPRDNEHLLNMAALSLNAYKCCGIKNYEDIMYENEIPFTCCSRSSYASIYVRTSNNCNTDNIYDGCYKKLSQFMIQKTMFVYVKLFMSILVIFNLFYSLSTHGWVFLFAKYQIQKPLKNKAMKAMLSFRDLTNSRTQHLSLSSSHKLSSISNSLKSLGRNRVISTFNDKEYLLDIRLSSDEKTHSVKSNSLKLKKNKSKIKDEKIVLNEGMNKSLLDLNIDNDLADPKTANASLLPNMEKSLLNSKIDNTLADLKPKNTALYPIRKISSLDNQTKRLPLYKNKKSQSIHNVEKTAVDPDKKITSKDENFKTPGNIENMKNSVLDPNKKKVSVVEKSISSSLDSSQESSAMIKTSEKIHLDSNIPLFRSETAGMIENEKHDILDPPKNMVSFDTNTKSSVSALNKKDSSKNVKFTGQKSTSIRNENTHILNPNPTSLLKRNTTNSINANTKKSLLNDKTKTALINPTKKNFLLDYKMKTSPINPNKTKPSLGGKTKTFLLNLNKKKPLSDGMSVTSSNTKKSLLDGKSITSSNTKKSLLDGRSITSSVNPNTKKSLSGGKTKSSSVNPNAKKSLLDGRSITSSVNPNAKNLLPNIKSKAASLNPTKNKT